LVPRKAVPAFARAPQKAVRPYDKKAFDKKAGPSAVVPELALALVGAVGPSMVSVSVMSEAKKRREPVFVALLLDTSGSMAGSKLLAAKEGISELKAALQPCDLVMVITFASEVKKLTPKPVAPDDVNVSRVEASGSTHLYDAILEVKFKRNAGRRPLLVVLTDGEDTSGSSPELARRKLSEPGVENFQCLLLGVGDEAKTQLSKLDPQKPNVRVKNVENSQDGIRRAFQYVTERVLRISLEAQCYT